MQRTSSLLLISLLGGIFGCSQQKEIQGAIHPILDKKIRPGDSLLVDLNTLLRERIIVEGDLILLRGWVQSREVIKDHNPSVLDITYRQLLRESLVMDISGESLPCPDCKDSIWLSTPDFSIRFYIGMGRTSLQKMLRSALDSVGEVSGKYTGNQMDRKPNLETWQKDLESLPGIDDMDKVLLREALALVSRERNATSDYTFGQLLAAVDMVKEMDGYQDVHRLFEQSLQQKDQP